MRDASAPRSGLSLPGRHQGERLQGQGRTKGVLKLNWEWYGAWIGIINGAMITAGLYYVASGRPTGSSGMAPGLPLIGLGAIVGAALCGVARIDWPDKTALLPKSIRLLYRIFIILAVLFYIALLLSAVQSLVPLPPGWQLPL